jgi:hypothetical protein
MRTGAEGSFASAGEYRHPQFVIVSKIFKRLPESPENFGIQSIHDLGTVNDNLGNPAFFFLYSTTDITAPSCFYSLKAHWRMNFNKEFQSTSNSQKC